MCRLFSVQVAVGLILLLGCRTSSESATVPKPPSAQEMAKILDADVALERTVSQNAANEKEPKPLWVASYRNEDDEFPVVTISLFRGGEFLTPERMAELGKRFEGFQKDIAKLERDGIEDAGDLENDTFRRWTLPTGQFGYGFIAGFGPGGTAYAATCPTKDRKYDLLLEISISHSDPVIQTKWYERFQEQGPLVVAERVLMRVSEILFDEG